MCNGLHHIQPDHLSFIQETDQCKIHDKWDGKYGNETTQGSQGDRQGRVAFCQVGNQVGGGPARTGCKDHDSYGDLGCHGKTYNNGKANKRQENELVTRPTKMAFG